MSKKEVNSKEEKMSLGEKFRGFCHGVVTESKRVHWTEKKDLVKYSIATLAFVIFFALFFYVIDIIFALVHSLIG